MLLQLVCLKVLEQILETFVNKWSTFSLSSLKQNTPNKSFPLTFSTYTGMICFSCQLPFHPKTILSRMTAAPTTLLGEHRDCGGASPPLSTSGLLCNFSNSCQAPAFAQELGGEAFLNCTRNSCKAKVGAALTVPGTPAAWTGWETGVGINSHSLIALERSLPELLPE